MEKSQISEEEIKNILSQQPHLALQSFETLKSDKLSPLTFEIMSRQSTLNIGTIGHVAHGKTTLVRAISGVYTIRHKIEKERNITFKLGYANAKLYKCPKCKGPEAYKSFGSEKEDQPKCDNQGCDAHLELQRHISFVDCPGHDILMATMLNGAAVMDAALLLVAANETCPQPQTSEHLAAVEIMNLKNIIILQNKIDIVMKDGTASEQFNHIKKFVQGTNAQNSPIIPISAQLKYNMDVVVNYMCKLPIPNRDFISPPKFIVVRSFDVNKSGCEAKDLKGGVAGGTLIRGVIKVGDIVEIRPGNISIVNGETKVTPLLTKIESLLAEKNQLIYAVPGGLIGVGLKIDPHLTKANNLEGRILGHPGKLPEVFTKIEIKCHLLRRLLGVRQRQGNKDIVVVGEIKKQELLLLNVGSTSVGGKVSEISGNNKDIITFDLQYPVCSEIGEKIAISRKLDKSFRLIGWGEVIKGVSIENTNN